MPPKAQVSAQYKSNPFIATTGVPQQSQTEKPVKKSMRASIQKMAISGTVSANPWKSHLLKKSAKLPPTPSLPIGKKTTSHPTNATTSRLPKQTSITTQPQVATTINNSVYTPNQLNELSTKQDPAPLKKIPSVTNYEPKDQKTKPNSVSPLVAMRDKRTVDKKAAPSKPTGKENERSPVRTKKWLNPNLVDTQPKSTFASLDANFNATSPSSHSSASSTTTSSAAKSVLLAKDKQDRPDAATASTASLIPKVSKTPASPLPDIPILATHRKPTSRLSNTSLKGKTPTPSEKQRVTQPSVPHQGAVNSTSSGSVVKKSRPISARARTPGTVQRHTSEDNTCTLSTKNQSMVVQKQSSQGHATHEPPAKMDCVTPVNQEITSDELPWIQYATPSHPQPQTEMTYSSKTEISMMADPAEIERQLAVSHAVLTALSFPTLSIEQAIKWHKRSRDTQATLVDIRNRALRETLMQRAAISLHKLTGCTHRDFLLEMQQRTENVDNLVQELYFTFLHVYDTQTRYLEHVAGTLAVTVQNEESWHNLLPSVPVPLHTSASTSAPSSVIAPTSNAPVHVHIVQRLNTIVKKCKSIRHCSTRCGSATTAETGSDEDDHESMSGDSLFSRSVRTSATSFDHLPQVDVNSMLDDIEKQFESFADNQNRHWHAERQAILAQCHPILGQSAASSASAMVAQLVQHFGEKIEAMQQTSMLEQQRLQTEIQDLKSQLAANVEREKTLERKLHERPSAVDYRALQARISELEALEQTPDKHAVDARHTEQLQERILELERQCKMAQDQWQAARNLLDQSLPPTEKSRMQARIADLECKLASKSPESLHARIAHLESQLQAEQSKRQDLAARDQAKAERITELERQLETKTELGPGEPTRQTLERVRAAFQAAQEEFTRRESAQMLQSASVEAELDHVLREYDRLTRNIVDFNAERRKFEAHITELQRTRQALEKQVADYKIKEDLGKDGQSITLRREFRQLMADVKTQHQVELDRERNRCAAIQKELRDVKHRLELKRWETVNKAVQTHFVAYSNDLFPVVK